MPPLRAAEIDFGFVSVGMTQTSDVLLLPLLLVKHEQESEEILARLIREHAAPIIKGILKSKLRTHAGEYHSLEESEDLYSDVVVQLLARLQAFIASPSDSFISDFRGYVAVTTYNACHLYLRQKYPARWRLKNRLRYALTHRNDFALWQGDDGEWLCGLAAWRGGGKDLAGDAERLRQLADDAGALQRSGLAATDVSKAELAELLQAVFRHAGAPVRLDDLLSVVAVLQGVRDRVNVSRDERDSDGREGEIDVSPGFATEVERRSYLRRLWEEISQLPPLQRAALLLNLRDAHEGLIALLPLAGVATVRQIADAVGIPDEKFAGLWNDLPLEDAAIARLLGVTRQQVINLRKAARARLRRRMQEREKGKTKRAVISRGDQTS